MRAAIIILGLALMSIYIIHCEGSVIFADPQGAGAAPGAGAAGGAGTQPVDPDKPVDPAKPDAGADAGAGGEADTGDAAKPDDGEKANNTAIGIGSSSFKTMQIVVLPLVAAKIMY